MLMSGKLPFAGPWIKPVPWLGVPTDAFDPGFGSMRDRPPSNPCRVPHQGSKFRQRRAHRGRRGRARKACGTGMATYWGHDVEDAARLEAALQRIAQAREAARKDQVPLAQPPVATAEAARRLDSLIADIRALLGKDSAD
jgi:hypothetical protein